MYGQRCNMKRMYLQPQFSPKRSFLSPGGKFGQRSFSASSFNSPSVATPLPGSLREQIRLDAFKKSLADSKLSKTALHRATLKVDGEQRSMFRSDVRGEVRELQREIAIVREENVQLKQQRTSDMMLISKQNELLGRMQRELNELKEIPYQQQKQCECYLMQQYLETIRNLEMKIDHLEEQRREYKKEIRELVVKQEQLKMQLEQGASKKKSEASSIRDLGSIKGSAKGKPGSKPNPDQGVLRYMQYLKNVRNREIDEIESILKSE